MARQRHDVPIIDWLGHSAQTRTRSAATSTLPLGMDDKNFREEIRRIICDRINMVAEDLHERGRRWADLFSEEDARAIDTLTIETFGESDQEAAEREEKRKEKDRMKIRLSISLDEKKNSDTKESREGYSPCHKEEGPKTNSSSQSSSQEREIISANTSFEDPRSSRIDINDRTHPNTSSFPSSSGRRSFYQNFGARMNRAHPYHRSHYAVERCDRHSRGSHWTDYKRGSKFGAPYGDKRHWTWNTRRYHPSRSYNDRYYTKGYGLKDDSRQSRSSLPPDKRRWERSYEDRYH
ncbi:hypothetical protein Q1695_003655 [Nippostrongylus brasiliensis]|nr:hypothetical protein Q1695_003655 [Nippostrongylus brasiliensis]